MTTAPDQPPSSQAAASDLVTWEEATELFRQAGVRVTRRTIHRWAVADKVPIRCRGKALVASWSDLLVAHASRYPSTGRP